MHTLKKTSQGYEFCSRGKESLLVRGSGNRIKDLCELARQVSRNRIRISVERDVSSETLSSEDIDIFYRQYVFEES